MPEFDKYAPYVFWAYGIAVVVLAGLVVWSVLRLQKAQRALKKTEEDRR